MHVENVIPNAKKYFVIDTWCNPILFFFRFLWYEVLDALFHIVLSFHCCFYLYGLVITFMNYNFEIDTALRDYCMWVNINSYFPVYVYRRLNYILMAKIFLQICIVFFIFSVQDLLRFNFFQILLLISAQGIFVLHITTLFKT